MERESGQEEMILIPSDRAEIVQDEVDHLLREFSAPSFENARKEFEEWRKSRWEDVV
jgi:hypothetical protein